MTQIVCTIFGLLTLGFSFLSIRLWQQVRSLNLKYQPMIDAEEQVRKAEQKLDEEKQRQKTLVADTQQRVTKLEIQYEDELARYKVYRKKFPHSKRTWRTFPSDSTSPISAFRPRKNTS
jgi:hypothetical protein